MFPKETTLYLWIFLFLLRCSSILSDLVLVTRLLWADFFRLSNHLSQPFSNLVTSDLKRPHFTAGLSSRCICFGGGACQRAFVCAPLKEDNEADVRGGGGGKGQMCATGDLCWVLRRQDPERQVAGPVKPLSADSMTQGPYCPRCYKDVSICICLTVQAWW